MHRPLSRSVQSLAFGRHTLRSLHVGRLFVMLNLACFAGSTWAQEDGVRLTVDARPAAAIVLPDEADAMHREAALLIRDHLERMSGARLPVVRERELRSARVVRGRIEEGEPADVMVGDEGIPGDEAVAARDPVESYVLVGGGELADRLEIDDGGLGPGGIRLKTTGNVLVLIGGPSQLEGVMGSDSAGIRHAAIELLERLGCRYLWPGELGMVIPHRPTITIEPLEVAYTPQIRRRGIRWGQNVGHDRFDSGLEQLGLTPEQWEAGHRKAMGDEPEVAWATWQRLGGSMPEFGHNGGGLGHDGWERYGERHPDWFALQADGTRSQEGAGNRWRLCKSNPELIEHVALQITKRADKDPDLQLVSLDPNDGGYASWCMCDDCRALDHPDGEKVDLLLFEKVGSSKRRTVEYVSLTERLVFYWNSIAERVTEKHPDLLFGVSAYSRFSAAPVARELHPNLVVRYVPASVDGWKPWQEKGARQVFWRPNILLQGWHDGKLRVYVDDLAEAMSTFAGSGMIQTDINTIRHWWGVHGLNYYAAARLCWDPYLSADEIVADFARHGFGDGASYIRRYFERLEELTEAGVVRKFRSERDHRYTPEAVAELRAMLNAAEDAAGDDADVVNRIAFLRIGLNFTELQERLTEMSWRAEQGEDVDRELVRRLVDLNCLVLRDIALNHNLVANTPYQMWRGGANSAFAPVDGDTTSPSDAQFLKRLEDSRYGMTGRENSIEEMLQAFGL